MGIEVQAGGSGAMGVKYKWAVVAFQVIDLGRSKSSKYFCCRSRRRGRRKKRKRRRGRERSTGRGRRGRGEGRILSGISGGHLARIASPGYTKEGGPPKASP